MDKGLIIAVVVVVAAVAWFSPGFESLDENGVIGISVFLAVVAGFWFLWVRKN